MAVQNLYKSTSESFMICLDDDTDFLRSLKMSLTTKFQEATNYNLLFMDSPFETLELIEELVDSGEQIALLMTDQMMPDMKGIDFLKRAKKLTPGSMRVLLTGHAGMNSAITAINENVLDKYLTKPVADIEDLIFTLKRLLNEFQLKNTVDAQQRVILDLYRFSNTLGLLNNLDEILNHTVAFTREALACERISILLLESGVLTIKASTGISEELVKKVRIPLGTEISGSVLQNRQPIIVKDIDELSWLKNKINSEFKSFISAPVISAELRSFDVPLGVINVTNKRGNDPFTEQDLKVLSFIANTASIAINNQSNAEMLEQSYFDTVSALIMALEARDEYTKGHSVRVMKYSEGIARHLGLDEQMVRMIRDSAILHDIGKIGVRDDVLLKAGSLSQEEVTEIKKHPVISDTIVNNISSLQEAAKIIRQHHEQYDGSGYPDRLKAADIHIGARIMAVADAYDAMTSNRPYRKAFEQEKAFNELRKGAGSQFDPHCVEAFFEYIKKRERTTVTSETSTKA